jgi:opacity protein-like surface antigen
MIKILFGFALAAFLSSPAHAEDHWAAIAWSKPQGVFGAGYAYTTRQGADDTAMAQCQQHGGTECFLAAWGRNGCIAIAAGSNNNPTNGWAPTRAEAETNALQACQRSIAGCSVRAWACSG